MLFVGCCLCLLGGHFLFVVNCFVFLFGLSILCGCVCTVMMFVVFVSFCGLQCMFIGVLLFASCKSVFLCPRVFAWFLHVLFVCVLCLCVIVLFAAGVFVCGLLVYSCVLESRKGAAVLVALLLYVWGFVWFPFLWGVIVFFFFKKQKTGGLLCGCRSVLFFVWAFSFL